MVEGISDKKLIKDLQELESFLWKTLLEKKPFTDQDRDELIQNTAYNFVSSQNIFTLAQQKLEGTAPIYLSVYEEVVTLMTAIPAIQKMQDSKNNWGISIAKYDFNKLPPEIQKSVQAVLERARSKLYDVRTEYASFGETSGDQAGTTDEEKQSNRQLGLQLRELLSIVPATSLSLEAPRRQSDGVLQGMRQAAQEAAGAFGGAVQNLINRFMGGGRSQGQ